LLSGVDPQGKYVTPGRNDPCPCGSGKKYKKCCAATSSISAGAKPGEIAAEAQRALLRSDHRRALMLALTLRKSNPNHPEAMRLCGLAYLGLEEWEQARCDLEQLLKSAPADAAIHSNLGFALLRLNRPADAERHCRIALSLDSQFADAHNNLAQALAATDRYDESEAAYRQAIASNPLSAAFRFNLGALLQSSCDRLAAAEQRYREAIAINPEFAPALANLGVVCLIQGRQQEARDYLQRAHAADSGNAEVMNNLGIERLQAKDYVKAEEWFRRAIKAGDYLPAYANLGVALENSGDMRGAIENYWFALERDTKNGLSWKNLAKAIVLSNDVDGAQRLITRAEPALSWLSPDFYPWFMNACQQTGDMVCLDKVRPLLLAALRAGTLSDDDLSGSLLLLNYDDSIAEEEIFRIHVEWSRRVTATVPAAIDKLAQPRSGKIRLGYLSPDFRRHSVGYFFRDVVAQHDKSRFEIFCYANMRGGDQFTEAIRDCADHFEYVRDLEDRELAERIRAHGIDILIDLAGHTRNGRVQCLAARPAPVQLTYLGYPNSTGADFVDYWITDVHAHRPDDFLHTEKLLCLPESFLCFGGTDERPISAVPPAVRNGYVTFGSFNNLAKLSRTTLRLWAGVLNAVPHSRLMLKANGAAGQPFRANVASELIKYGVENDRLVLVDRLEGVAEHLDCYNDVDIALDAVPYNGTTTTCEALWMGVPVLTLVGDAHRQRTSYSILKNIGIDETIARNEAQFVAIASRFARDMDMLSDLRVRTAKQFRESIVCSPKRFTQQFENALCGVLP